MCGIAGAAARNGYQVPPLSVARQMCDVIVHRGPDAEGIHHSPDVMLGMRRLAIIDVGGGDQPIYNETGEICAVVNGEIYNYRDLRRRLEKMGHVFRTNSDVECIVHAYEEYGAGCFAELRGMFAVALWDERSRSLVLARDRFGKKPLFYTETPRGLFFASELKSLLRVPGIEPEVDHRVMADYMLLGYVPTPRSIYAGVHKLEPGHSLVFHDGHVRVRRYWSLRYGPKLDLDEGTLVDMLDKQVDAAVCARLVSDVPFGAFLSGGVDSSLVVAMMQRHLDAPVKTFSIGFDDAEFDESAEARRVARHLGTEHHELVVHPDAVNLLETIAWHVDEPMADSSIIPTYLVSKLAAEHVKMVLTGDGGDEMFGGYTRYAQYMQLMKMRGAGLAYAAPLLARIARHAPPRLGARITRVCERLRMPHPDDYLASVALGRPSQIARLLKGGLAGADGFALTRGRAASGDEELGPLDSIINSDVRSYLLDDVLVKVDRATMANSLEARSPLLDQHLAAFAARLPESFKVRGNVTKYLLKRVAERYMPAEWVHRKKQGFAVPLARWLREDLAEMLLDTVNARAFAEQGVFNANAVRQLAREHMDGAHDHSAALWAVLIFETWARRNREYVRPPIHAPLPELKPAAT